MCSFASTFPFFFIGNMCYETLTKWDSLADCQPGCYEKNFHFCKIRYSKGHWVGKDTNKNHSYGDFFF